MQITGLLRAFEYVDEKDNALLLDCDRPHVNVLRRQNISDPVSADVLDGFDSFREKYMDNEGFGLAYRGQQQDWALQSSYKRYQDAFPSFRPDEGIYYPPIGETDYQQYALNVLLRDTAYERMAYPPQNDLLLALCQHYGAPSPLLDWTLSIKKALFFAFEAVNPNSSIPAAIYIADIGKIHRMNYEALPDSSKSASPRQIIDALTQERWRFDVTWMFMSLHEFGDIRIMVQDAVFAWQSFQHSDEHLSMEQFLANPPSRDDLTSHYDFTPRGGALRIVKLPASEKYEVLDYLKGENITRDSMFPDPTRLFANIRDEYLKLQWQSAKWATEKSDEIRGLGCLERTAGADKDKTQHMDG